jgi:hypothetical protein
VGDSSVAFLVSSIAVTESIAAAGAVAHEMAVVHHCNEVRLAQPNFGVSHTWLGCRA